MTKTADSIRAEKAAARALELGQRQVQVRRTDRASGRNMAVCNEDNAGALACGHDLAGKRGVRSVVQVLLAHDERVYATRKPRHLARQRAHAVAPIRHGNAQKASLKQRVHSRSSSKIAGASKSETAKSVPRAPSVQKRTFSVV